MQSILGIFDLCAAEGLEVDILLTAGESHVTRARNNICATFLERTNLDHLIFIDADIEISAADFMQLAVADGVRGAAVACKTPDHSEILSVWADNHRPRRREMPQEPFLVDYLGSAVLAISRSVLEALKPQSDLYIDPIIGRGWEFFWDGVEDGTWLSEDYGFCRSCQAADIDIWCHPGIVVSHYGSGVWRG